MSLMSRSKGDHGCVLLVLVVLMTGGIAAGGLLLVRNLADMAGWAGVLVFSEIVVVSCHYTRFVAAGRWQSAIVCAYQLVGLAGAVGFWVGPALLV